MHGLRAFPSVEKSVNAAADDTENQIPVFDEEIGDGHDNECWSGQVRTEACEYRLERRDHENHDDGGDDKCHGNNSDRVKQSGFYFALDRLRFFLVGGQTVQQAVQNTGLFASANQVAKQRVEIQGMFFKCLFQAGTAFNLGFDRHQQFLYRCVAVTLTDDIKGLQQGYASLQHGRQLACKKSDVFVGDRTAAARR